MDGHVQHKETKAGAAIECDKIKGGTYEYELHIYRAHLLFALLL